MSIAPRKVRESLFSHYGIKAKKRGLLTSLKDKKEARVKNLHLALQEANRPREQDLKELFGKLALSSTPAFKSDPRFLENRK